MLLTSIQLENKLKQLQCASHLKSEILKYIDLNQNKHKGIAGVSYRANLDYILNNLHNVDKLFNELKKY